MSLRIRIFIIISLGVLLVLGVSFLLLRNRSQKITDNKPTTTSTSDTTGFTVIDANNFDTLPTTPGSAKPSAQVVPKKFDDLEAVKNGVKQLAKVFIERYGSYSSDNNAQNIKEVQALVTADLWRSIQPSTNPKKPTEFLGVTTKVAYMEMSSWSDTQAEVKFKAIRTQDKNGVISSSQQAATVSLVKQGTSWLVNKFVWQ
jgi:hypothetical protein